MKEARARQRPACVFGAGTVAGAGAGVVAVLFLAAAFLSGCDRSEAAVRTVRPDVIVIGAMKAFGELERPAVRFAHDKHTRAVAGGGGDCTTCHLRDDDGNLVPRYMRLEDSGYDAMMEVYHDHCVACHKETESAGKASGPVTCGECHRREPAMFSSAVGLMFDRSLHHRHVVAEDENCETCHHEVEGEPHRSSCRDCHRAETVGDSRSMRLVAHKDCIGCHARKTADGAAAGPVECSGCHDRELQRAYDRVDEPARLDAGQPVTAIVQPANADLERSRMGVVFFNHAGHEGYSASCRVCHHESLKPCRECHTLQGGPTGSGVTLEQAMHDPNSSHSCMGCHNEKKTETQCAGCHSLVADSRLPAGSCDKCHSTIMPEKNTDGSTKKRLEALGYAAGNEKKGFSADADDIPGMIRIADLSDRFEAAHFPHRLIIDELREHVNSSRIATHFHRGDDMICAGCHHHSPVGQIPPRCGSCHGKPFDEKNLSMPGLTGAYHQQCMGCHQEMGLHELNTCTSCHEEKEKPVAQDNLPRKEEDR